MASGPAHKHHFRTAILIAGLAVLLGGFLVDALGLGDLASFGRGQTLLLLLGLGLVVAGLAGERAVRLYRAVAIISLNTVVLLLGLELLAIAVARSGLMSSPGREVVSQYPELPFYSRHDWSSEFWNESHRAESYRYRPYAGWRSIDPLQVNSSMSTSSDCVTRPVARAKTAPFKSSPSAALPCGVGDLPIGVRFQPSCRSA